MLAAVLLTLAALLGACRSVVTTRGTAPLPEDAVVALGATAGLGAQHAAAVDLRTPDHFEPSGVLTAAGVASFRVLGLERASLELDVGAGGASELLWGRNMLFAGGLGAARGWWAASDTLFVGLELGAAAGVSTTLSRPLELDWGWLQPEARVPVAWRFDEITTLSSRPGLLWQIGATLQERTSFTRDDIHVLAVDVPVALTWDLAPLRLVAEVGVSSSFEPTRWLPTLGARAGVGAAWLF